MWWSIVLVCGAAALGSASSSDGLLVVNTWDFPEATKAAFETLQSHSAVDAVEEVGT